MSLKLYYGSWIVLGALVAITGYWWRPVYWSLLFFVPVFLLGVWNTVQTKRAILRNYPVFGLFRYGFESIRPEIYQYFVESDTDGRPFNRERRSIVYQRAKKVRDTIPFGTKHNVYATGYEWMSPSLQAQPLLKEEPRIMFGEERCKKPYSSSLLNISAMSYGSLSREAIRALNSGARIGGFYHNSGEGGVSKHHLEPGGDIVWQIGTGYFGCRNTDGGFDREAFKDRAQADAIKMIEIKLSQGAKPGHGGILPAAKITPEIAEMRGIPMGADVLSPPTHSAFSSPRGLIEFAAELRELSGGKPVGFKLCVGHPSDVFGICMAMRETGLEPDFITVDGGEGGTGAAPLEFSNSLGAPLTEGLFIVVSALLGFSLRDKVRVIASGRILTGCDMAIRKAIGADTCNSARGFMMALGCIQALQCNSNKCPVGVATQDPKLTRGLVIEDKMHRVANFHTQTVHAFLELLAASGLKHPSELRAYHVFRRVSQNEIRTLADIYPYPADGEFLGNDASPFFQRWLKMASPDSYVCLVQAPTMHR